MPGERCLSVLADTLYSSTVRNLFGALRFPSIPTYLAGMFIKKKENLVTDSFLHFGKL
jgi:hypothetical protein